MMIDAHPIIATDEVKRMKFNFGRMLRFYRGTGAETNTDLLDPLADWTIHVNKEGKTISIYWNQRRQGVSLQ